MGRGTAILRFGSALHSRRFPGPSAQRLFCWLECQLDMRGVDPALYSRYLISLLQLDDAEFERSEISDHELDSGGVGGGGKRSSGKRSKRRRQQQPPSTDSVSGAAIGLASGVSSRKRAAAVQCLQSACSDPYEVDELIDELCYRLKRLNSGARAPQHPVQPQPLPLLPEEASDGPADSGRDGSPDNNDDESGEAEGVTEPGDVGESAADAHELQQHRLRRLASQAEDYGCAFPALASRRGLAADQRTAAAAAAAATAAAAFGPQGEQLQVQPMQQPRQDRSSAWSRGPPRGLAQVHQRQQRLSRRLRATAQRRRRVVAGGPAVDDEGFLEGEEVAGEESPAAEAGDEAEDGDDDEEEVDDEEEADADDAESVASEGSEILQLVSHILHSFNRELEDEIAAAAAAAASAAGDGGGGGGTSSDRANPSSSSPPLDGDGELLPAMMLMDDDAGVLSDHDFDNLPSQEADQPELLLECDDGADATEAGNVDSTPPPVVAMATGILTLPADLVANGMANWTALDRLRHQMWSRKPLPPRPQPPPQPPRSPHHQRQRHQQPLQHQQQQPMTPMEKSKRACSFLLRGHCKKEDCEFAHDLARVTCRFWAAGECFKGDTCPFRHGGPPSDDEAEDAAAVAATEPAKKAAVVTAKIEV